MAAFFFGYSLGLLTVMAVVGLLIWWVAGRVNKDVTAKFLEGMSLAVK